MERPSLIKEYMHQMKNFDYKKHNLNKSTLADLTGFHRVTVWRWMTGVTRVIDLEFIVKMEELGLLERPKNWIVLSNGFSGESK